MSSRRWSGPTRVKVCCISSVAEARLAVQHGASALGLVAEMPSGPGVIDDEHIAEIAVSVPPPVATFLLTSRTDSDAIIDHLHRCRTSTVQIVDEVDVATYARIRKALPSMKIVQVLHVNDTASVDMAERVAPHVDALLLDSGNPSLGIKELGGTGRVHDWDISRQIVDSVDQPTFLAGGLRPENVGSAIRTVRPYGVDLCSGVRTGDRLSGAKLGQFFAAVAEADTPPVGTIRG